MAQEKALIRIWDSLKIFMDEKTPKVGVPRTPSGGWKDELKKLRVSYSGEVVEKAGPLTLAWATQCRAWWAGEYPGRG